MFHRWFRSRDVVQLRVPARASVVRKAELRARLSVVFLLCAQFPLVGALLLLARAQSNRLGAAALCDVVCGPLVKVSYYQPSPRVFQPSSVIRSVSLRAKASAPRPFRSPAAQAPRFSLPLS